MKRYEDSPEATERPPILDRFVSRPAAPAVARDNFRIVEAEPAGYDPYANPGPPPDPPRDDAAG